MFFLLFGFWVLLNGSWTLEIALIGLVVSAALYAFIVKFMGYSPKKEWAIVRLLPSHHPGKFPVLGLHMQK